MARRRPGLAAAAPVEPDYSDLDLAQAKSANLALLPPAAVRVTAHRGGYRRAGRAWPATPGVLVQPTELTAEQWSAVKSDPHLTLTPNP